MSIFESLLPWRNLAMQHEEILMKLADLDEVLAGLGTQLAKAKDEILNKIAVLEAALADVDLPVEAEAALEDLAGTVQALDDVVPDPTPPAAE